ncbi:MAG TPA: NRDE family protein [Mycobacteriales bacterium]|nr:NRDE family protein [Mycobacteriales bacterium]
MRWSPGRPTQILALRDELTTRAFDDPGEWWPELPDVIGGRDQVAGGTWCASRVGTGVTALVLNRPQKRAADAGAPSRGVLPLLAVEHEQGWAAHLDPEGMASFALVLVTPVHVTTWDFDGAHLTENAPGAGTHMVTSGGIEDGKAERYLDAFRSAADADEWRTLIRRDTPSADLTELVVRREGDGMVYATVFGQLIEAEPGRLSVQYSRTPWRDDGWKAVTRRS